MTQEEMLRMRRAATDMAFDWAARKFNTGGKYIGGRSLLNLRQLLPFDINLASWKTPPQKENVNSTWGIPGTIRSDRVITLVKISVIGGKWHTNTETIPGINMLTINRGKGEAIETFDFTNLFCSITQRNIENICLMENTNYRLESYFSEPLFFGPNDHVELTIRSMVDNEGDYLVLGGYVVTARDAKIPEKDRGSTEPREDT